MEEKQEKDVFAFFEECVLKKSPSEWNLFRKRNRKLNISFEGRSITKWELSSFNLRGIDLSKMDLTQAIFEECIFDQAKMDKVQAFGARFIRCSLVSCSMQEGNFVTSYFLECDLRYSDLAGSRIHQSFVKQCKADNSILSHVSFYDTCMAGTSITYADISGSDFKNVQLHRTDFTAVSVDGDTIFWDCYYDKMTNFTGVGLGSCRVEPVLLSSFQCNIRRIWWANWYQEKKDAMHHSFKMFLAESIRHPLKKILFLFKGLGAMLMDFVVKFFWWITDYGSSTIRLILVFLSTTLAFAAIYSIFPHITNDAVLRFSENHLLVFIRSLYFSVIVMTGLGFGEINASEMSYFGHIIILIQSLSGYILLGAFLVRIGILFQGEFPVSPVRKKVGDMSCDPDGNCELPQNENHEISEHM